MKLVIIYIALISICVIGWVDNIIKLVKCDFEPSYKTEIIRGVGVFVFPVGIVVGYMDLKDEKTK